MTSSRLCLAGITALSLTAMPAVAQDDDSGGRLVRLLENTLSDDNRTIDVVGLDGALSSRATIERLTVSDDNGVWFTLEGAVLDWNRLALVRGRFSVNELTAERIVFERPPGETTTDEDLPAPEATPFQVPELPVAIEIGQIGVSTIVLGEALTGTAAELSLDGRVSLADGALDAALDLQRLDRPGDQIGLIAAFSNETRQLTLDLTANEGPGGLIGTALSLPDDPSVALELKGDGPLEDFAANLSLETNGELRFGGDVTLRGLSPETNGNGDVESVPLQFLADLGGDIRPLLPAQFHEFFGPDTRIQTSGQRNPDGALTVEALSVMSQALDLDGSLSIGADGAVDTLALDGAIVPPSGQVVTLPVSGQTTTVELVRLSAKYDAATSRDWDIDLSVENLAGSAFAVDSATLRGRGQAGAEPGQDMLNGGIAANLIGLSLSDPALAEAAGDTLSLAGDFRLVDAGQLILDTMHLTGAGLDATVDATIDGLDSGLKVETAVDLKADDIARFGKLAQLDLGGALDAQIEGHVVPLSGAFSITLEGIGRDLTTGIAQVDPLITGRTLLSVDAARDETGVTLREFAVNGTAITAEAEGTLSSQTTQLRFDAEIDDLARVVPDLPGPGTLSGDVRTEGKALVGTVNLKAPRGISLAADGRYEEGATRAELNGQIDDLGIFVEQFPGAAQLVAQLDQSGEAYTGSLRLLTEGGSQVNADGVYGPGQTTARFDANLVDLGVFVPQMPGEANVSGTVEETERGYDGSIRAETADGSTLTAEGLYGPNVLSATFQGVLADLGIFVPVMAGRAIVSGKVDQNGPNYDGTVQARAADGSTLNATGTYGPETLTGRFDAALANLAAFVPQMPGRATAEGEVTQDGDAFKGNVTLRTADGSTAEAKGTYGPGQTAGTVNAALADLGIFVPQMPGGATVAGQVTERDGAYRGTVEAKTADGSTLTAEGAYGDAEKAVSFDATLANLGRFVQQLQGSAHLTGQARETDGVYQGKVDVDGGAGVILTASGDYDPAGRAQITYDAALDRVQRLIPDFPGRFVSQGTAALDGATWQINSTASGPAGVQATLSGSYNQDSGSADIAAQGQAQMAAANAFIAPMALDGPARFDLRLNGQPALSSISGTVDLPGTRVAIPQVYGQIDPLTGRITLANGTAQVALRGQWLDGGGFSVDGPLSLDAPFTAGLEIAINQLVLTDKALYETSLDGRIGVDGPLTGNGRISGVINVGSTELNIAASAGAAAGSPIPPIAHRGEDSASYATRKRAGLIEEGDSQGGGGSGPAYGLDITISAPQQIFVRGRGLDAELGGGLSLSGTTANVIPAGEIDLIRGRLDIVGRRLDLTRGQVTLQGSFDPYIDFAATNTSSAGTATIEIFGPLQSPEVEVTSSPARPPEEALGLLIFGDQFTNLSPLKIAQLASSLATLTGQGGGGGGILGNAREGIGASSLDLTTDEDGNAQVGVGAYLSDNIYSDVAVNTEGRTELNLNLDVTNNVTAKGKVDSEGTSSIGLFFSKDY